MKTMEDVKEIQELIENSFQDTGKSVLPPPGHLKDAMGVLEKCVLDIAEAFDRIDGMNGVKRFFRRRELKAEAEACAADVGRALQLFQVCVVIVASCTLFNKSYSGEATN